MVNQSLRLLSWNVRDMNNALKRQSVFDYSASFHPALICLQETHATPNVTRFLKHCSVRAAYYSLFSSNSRGVSILVYAGVIVSCSRTMVDEMADIFFYIVSWMIST